MQNRALIVESHLLSRRELVHDLASAGVVGEIIEAESIQNGLETIHREPLSACFLGPKLQSSTALGFITEARSVPIQRECTFVVVSKEKDALSRSELSRAVDATISYPYTKDTFCNAVADALLRSQQPRPRIGGSPERLIFSLAADLRAIARQITEGRLKLDRSGAPTVETALAIRTAFEKLAPLPIQARDDFFIRAVSAWFTDRSRTTGERACQMLRTRLLEM